MNKMPHFVVNPSFQVIDLFENVDPAKKINVHFRSERPLKYMFLPEDKLLMDFSAMIPSVGFSYAKTVSIDERFLVVTSDDHNNGLDVEKYVLGEENFEMGSIWMWIVLIIICGALALPILILVISLIYHMYIGLKNK